MTVMIINIVLTALITVVICLFISTLFPGIERKYIHARIQQRIGPPITSPGIMAPLKFFYKKNIEPSSPLSGLYSWLPIVCFAVILVILIALTPQAYYLPALSSLIAIIGLLKVEEISYVLMGALSKSVMSVRMPFPDIVKGAAHIDKTRSFIEDISSKRSLRMITYGSFPLYLALFGPVTQSRSIFLQDIVTYQQIHGPYLFTISGFLATIVFFVGYMVLLNEYPFSFIKAKSDVIEGPYMEYAANSRAIVFITRGFLMFVLGSLFSVLFIGIPPNILSWGILINIGVALIFVFLMGIFSAFTPVFTNRQLLPTIFGSTVLGILSIIIGLL